MALLKTIRDVNGLPVAYHRVSQIDIETNLRVGVWTKGYINADEREAEKNGETVYSSNAYYATDGPEGPSNAEEAYEWLKGNRPEFDGAEDC